MEEKDLVVKQSSTIIPSGNSLPLLSMDILSDEALLKIENQITMLHKLKMIAIKITNASDWCDQSGKPYLQATGTDKIAMLAGISILNMSIEKEEYKDEIGRWYLFTAKATFYRANTAIECSGTGSTRDAFYAKATRCVKCGGKGYKGKCNDNGCGGAMASLIKPLSEIDIPSVKKKAVTNLKNRGIKKILGLSFEWEDLSKAGIDIKRITTIDRKTPGGGNKPYEATEAHTKAWEGLIEICVNEKAASEKLSELTSFQGRDGKVPGKTNIKDVSDKQAGFLWGKVKSLLEKNVKANGKSTKKEEAPPEW